MSDDERRANFRRLEDCPAQFHKFHAVGPDERNLVECSECGGRTSRLAANMFYYGVYAGLNAAQHYASAEGNKLRRARNRMQAEFDL